MIDIETLSTRGHAVILAIGAIKFRRNGEEKSLQEMDVFFRRVNPSSCVELDMHIDRKTVDWWNEQDAKVRQTVFEGERIPLLQALRDLSVWYRQGFPNRIWSQGSGFDISILQEAYARCDLDPPWQFWQARDTRTLYDIAGFDPKTLPMSNLHDPVADCYRQIRGVRESLKKIEKPRKLEKK